MSDLLPIAPLAPKAIEQSNSAAENSPKSIAPLAPSAIHPRNPPELLNYLKLAGVR
jgi:hypothetical protein